MKRPPTSALVILGVALILAVLAVARLASRPSPAPADQAAQPVAPERAPLADEEPPPADDAEAIRTLNVSIYYPSMDGRGLVGEPHEIFMTPSPGDRAKQILADLIAGPNGEDALEAIPKGTRLRQVYVLDDGTAYVDVSADLKQGIGGGSAEELNAVYAIVNSVALNIPEIRRVGVLIDGSPIDTLNGHLDLRRPLPPNTSLILRDPASRSASGTPRRPADA